MPRKSARENGGFRRTGWKAKLAKREAEEKRIVKNIYIGASNAKRWIILKKKLEYRSDVDFVAYLLNLAEPFSGKGKLERKDQEDSDGKKIPISKVPAISVDEGDNTDRSQKSRGDDVDCNGSVDDSGEVSKGGDFEATDVVEGGEGDEEEDEVEEDEDDGGATVAARRGGGGSNRVERGGKEDAESEREVVEEEEEGEEEEEDEEEENGGGEWTECRQPLRRSLRSIPTKESAKQLSVRRSARNVHRGGEEEGEEALEEEGEEVEGEEVRRGGGEEGTEGMGEGDGEEEETVTMKKKKRGDRSERRQRRRERKKRRKRKRLEGSSEGEVEGGDGADEPEEEGEESEGGEEEAAAGVERGAKGAEESEVDGAQEGGSGAGEPPVPASIISEKHVEVEPVDVAPAVIEVEPPRKGKRGRKKKVVTLDVAAVAETVSVELDGVVEKEKGEAGEENRGEEPSRDCPSPIHPQDVIPEEVVRDDDSATTHHTDSVEEPAVAVTEGGESDRVSKHHRHHKRKSRKSRDSLEDEGEGGDDGGEGEDAGGDGWEGGEGRKRRRKKRGRQKRSIEECPPTLTAVTAVDVEEGDFAAEAVEEEENFPRYEVVEGVLGDAEALEHQEKAQGGMATQPGSEGTNVDGATAAGGVVQEEEEEGVLIEVGERVKLKRRRKRRHSRGGEEGEGDGEGGNGGDTSCEDHLGSLRRAAKHKKRKHGHGEGHSNRRKHHDVRKVPVDGVLPEQPPAPSTPLPNVENLPPEPSEDSLHESQANAASVSSLPTSTSMQPQSSLPAGANPATGASGAAGKAPADTKQRVAIRITLCGECDSRHVLDACPLKRPLTIIHDTVVLRETTADEESKDDDPGADGIPFGDNETKNFANEEEEEGEADDRQDAQDVTCKKKKKKSAGDDEDALISAGGKEQDDRRRRRNGFSEALEDRLSVPNGKYQQTSGDRSQLVVVAAQDEVKQVNGDNSDGSVTDGKEDAKEESSLEVGNNKLDAHEEDMLSNGDANLAPNSSLSPKPLVVNELESATETLASQPSPIPMPDPISASDTTVGGGNNSSGKSFAEASLPMALKLETREASHGPGVTAKRPIARFTQFGPLLGRKIREMDIPDDFGMRHIWEVMGASGRFLLSTEDPTSSNWLRFIRPAPTREQRNVAPVTRGDRLYFVTTAPLQVGEELLYWPDESSGTNAVATSGAAASSTPNSSSNPSSTSSSSSSASSSSGTGWAKKKMEKTNCGGCNLRFGHPLYYRLHCSVFHDPNFSLTIRKYHCKVCGAAVLGKENIMRHAAENHDGKGAYQCQFCKKFFLRLNYLEMHRTYGCAANPQRTRPLCDFCGRKFCQPQKLKVHIKRMHSDMADVLREFQCKLCLKLLGSRAALQRHMKEVHHRDVVGACACDRCGKTFQNKSNLKIHMLTHSGVKPFRCAEDNCPAAFTTKQCLQFHYKKVHGFAEDNMPSIERCVAYTFDAYSGGTVEDPGRGKVPLFAGTRLGKDADDMDSNQSTQALGSELGDDECVGAEGESPQQQPRVRKEASGEGKREKGGRGRGRRPGRPSGSGRVAMGVPSVTPETATPDSTAATLLHEENSGGGMHVKGIVEGDALVVVDSMVPPTIIPEDILPHHQDADVLPPPPPVIPSLPDGSVDCKEAMLGSMVDSQPPPLTPQPGPLPTEVAPQTPTLEAYNGGQAVLGPPTTMAQYTDHARVSFPGGKVVSKGSKKWMGDGSVPMRPSSEMDEEEDEEEEEEEDEEEEELEEDVGAKRAEEEEGEVVGVVHADGQVVADVYGAFPEDGRFADEAGPEEGFRRPEESNASLLVEAALDAAERDMTGGGGGVAEDEPKHPSEPNTDGYQLAPSPARTNGPDQQRPHLGDEGDHRVLHHPQASHHHALQQHHSHHPPSHHHLQHHPHHLSLHPPHPQLAHPHVHLPPPASHLHVQGGALMLHHSHHPHHHGAASSSIHSHHPSAHHAGGAGLHPDDDEDDDRLGPGSEANSVGTIVERIVNTSLAEDDETDGRDEVVVPHPSVRAMHHLLHPDTYAPEPHGRLPPAGSLPSPRNMTLLGMKAAVKVEEELQHMAALQQQRTEEDEEGEEEGLDMSYKHAAVVGHYGRAAGLAAHHMQQDEDEEGNQGVGPGDPSADELQDFRVLRSPQVVEGRFEQSSGGLDMSRGSFTFALPSAAAARCFPLYEGSGSAADVARSVDLRRAGLAYTSPPLPPYSQSLDLTPMRTRHSVDLSLPRSLVGSDGVGGPQQGSGGQSPPSPMHRHLCHAPPPVSPHHHVHHHPHGGGVDGIGGCIVGDDGGEGASGGGLSPPPPGSYQSAGGYLHGPPSYHRQGLVQHPPSPPPSPYHPQARTAPHMPPPPPAASPSPYHHYSGYY